MFFERVGKFCFGHLRPLFFYALMLFPLLFSALFIFFELFEIDDLQTSFDLSLKKGKIALERKASEERFLKRYSHSDPYFLDQQIEALSFLGREEQEIKALLNHPAISQRDPLAMRLDFIRGGENKIAFAEQNVRTSRGVKETEEKQRHPVQLNESDLEKLLSLIEDVKIGEDHPVEHPPQLLIQSFHLHRQTTPIETVVFSVDMALLKREFTK